MSQVNIWINDIDSFGFLQITSQVRIIYIPQILLTFQGVKRVYAPFCVVDLEQDGKPEIVLGRGEEVFAYNVEM